MNGLGRFQSSEKGSQLRRLFLFELLQFRFSKATNIAESGTMVASTATAFLNGKRVRILLLDSMLVAWHNVGRR